MSIDISTADNYDLEGNTGTDGDNGSHWPGGAGSMGIQGDAHTGTSKLQCNVAQSGWVDVGADVEFTADGVGGFELGPCMLRIVSGGGTNLSAAVTGPAEAP